MKINLAVFFGGKSVEHEISIITAMQAIKHINKSKYNIIPVYITRDNLMYTSDKMNDIQAFSDIDSLVKDSINVRIEKREDKASLYYINKIGITKVISNIDIALPVLHGTNVEDGTFQGYLETLSIPYVGCGVESSAACMNKYITKLLLKDAALPVIGCSVFYKTEYFSDIESTCDAIEFTHKYPMMIKPINLGSSIGVSKADNRESLKSCIELAFKYSNKILVENAVTNLKEINCSGLGDYEGVTTSLCEEPVAARDILSYEDKYLSGSKGYGGKYRSVVNGKGMDSLKRKLPADISEEQEDTIRRYTERAFKAMGCSGVVRIDFLIDLDTDEIYVNEINTIPGSLSYYLWEATGLKYEKLIDTLISLALKRGRQDEKLIFSVETNILKGFSGGNKI